MRRRRKKYRAATALLLAVWAPWSVHARDLCPLEIVGTWKAAAAEPQLLSFAADGWANVLGAQQDILAQVQYQLAPRRIEFRARRGNDLFPSGSSSWEITAHTDESFSARSSGDDSRWTRVQTHRYFLTFAARGDTTVFAMWTTLDGNAPVFEALGTTMQDEDPRFGRISPQLVKEFARQSDRTDDAMLRVELSAAEYRRTRQVFVSWDTLVTRDLLAREDPRHQALLLMDATVQSLNRCGPKVRSAGELAASKLQPLDLVRSLRKINDRAHVPDKAFPFRWQPPPAF